MEAYDFARLSEEEAHPLVRRGDVTTGVRVTSNETGCCFWGGRVEDVLLFRKFRKNVRKVLGLKGPDPLFTCDAVPNYTPCADCSELMSRGVTVFEVRSDQRPTGTYWVVTEKFIQQKFRPPAFVSQVLTHGEVHVDEGVARKLGLYGGG